MNFTDFQLRAWRAAPGVVEVIVHSSPVGEMLRPAAVRADLEALRAPVARMRGDFSSFSCEGPASDDPHAEMVALGQKLAAVLLPRPAHALLKRSLERVPREDGVRLRLCLDDELVDLPWELLFDPDETDTASSAGFLTLNGRISLVRGAPVAGRQLRPARRRQRLAFAGALHGSKEGDDFFQVRSEHRVLSEALQPLERLITVEPFVDSSGDNLRKLLSKPAVILHYGGHADVLEGQGHLLKGAVAANKAEYLRVDSLVPMLQRARTKLVVLSACNGGSWPVVKPLLRADLDLAAVVGVQGLVAVDSAEAFSQKLYEALALGHSLDEAVMGARFHLLDRASTIPKRGAPWRTYAWSHFMVYMPTTEAALFPEPKDSALKEREKRVRDERVQTIINVTTHNVTTQTVGTVLGGSVSGVIAAADPVGRGHRGEIHHRKGDAAMPDDHGEPGERATDRREPSVRASESAPRKYIDVNLELRDLDAAADTFTVVILPSPTVGESRPTAVPFRYGELKSQLAYLERKQLSMSKLMSLGERLGDRLLPRGEVRDLFRDAVKTAGRAGGVRLRLIVRDPRLAQLPWEYSYLQDGGGEKHRSNFLVLNPQVSVVRHEVMPEAHPPLAGADPARLRVVVAMANVETARVPGHGEELDFRELDLGRERTVLEEALAGVVVDGVTVDSERFLKDATKDDLSRALLTGADMFHFAGHAMFAERDVDPQTGEPTGAGYIFLRGSNGGTEGEPLAADDMAMLLQRAGVRVAVFGACESARRDGVSAWTGVVPALVKRGLPAAVAMQYDVVDEHAVAFSRMLYTSLAAGLPLDEAVSVGRQAMLAVAGSEVEWGVPVLYMRSPDGVIFTRLAERPSPARESVRLAIQQAVETIEAGGEVVGIEANLVSGSFVVKQRATTVKGKMTGWKGNL